MADKNMQMARRIVAADAVQGGRVYYVGGLVRDKLLSRENKDMISKSTASIPKCWNLFGMGWA